MRIHLRAAELIADKRDNLWFAESQLPEDVDRIGDDDILQIGDQYFEVLGYSDKRKAFWVCEIEVEGISENLEQELTAYVESMGGSES